MFLSPWKYHKFDKYVQGNFNLGMHESYQAEMSFPLVAANPCICQNLWVCYILDWVWFNCPELHHRVKTLPSVTLGNIQICPAVMKSSLGLPLASCSTKGRSRFSPCGSYKSGIPGGMLTAALGVYSSSVQVFFSHHLCYCVSYSRKPKYFPTSNMLQIFYLACCVQESRSVVTLSYSHSWTRIKAMNSFQSKPNLS